YDDIASVADLPRGWTDEQDGGRYRLHRRDDDALFGYAVGPHSWKKFLHPADLKDFVMDFLDLPDDELRHRCEQAVRNYPCISCATHFIRLDMDRGWLQSFARG